MSMNNSTCETDRRYYRYAKKNNRNKALRHNDSNIFALYVSKVSIIDVYKNYNFLPRDFR